MFYYEWEGFPSYINEVTLDSIVVVGSVMSEKQRNDSLSLSLSLSLSSKGSLSPSLL